MSPHTQAGNLPDLLRPQNAAEVDFTWVKAYGPSMRVKGAFGTDILLTADPKAMQYILNTTGYDFPKPQQKRATSRLTTGKGLTYAQGSQHARQRRIIAPAFSYATLREFLPLFRSITRKTLSKWRVCISHGGGTSAVLDMPTWLSKTTLDAIGEAAFNYDFCAIDEGNNELSEQFRNLLVDSFYNRSDFSLAFEAIWGYVPLWLVPIIQKLPTRRLRRLNKYMQVSRGVAKSIVDQQIQSHAAGKEGGKDVMSILIRANLSENPKTKLDEDEILSQLTTFMVAGHETTASTLTWMLYELSRHPGYQSRVRDEIKVARAQAAHRGGMDGELSVADLDSMKYTIALIKETLRYHSIVLFLYRTASRDDMIPLSVPLTTTSGEKITNIPVSKGQKIMISVPAYNRLQQVWGDDAHAWRPERFLGEEDKERTHNTRLGVLSNLGSFGSGIRSCIGWRFAVIEMQAVLVELIEAFEFSPAPGNPEIVRAVSVVMVPM
ncbi:cytochrome P450 [Ramaria rubella]|nr:cytochrome P450 [Ramaria rubella]